MSTGKKARPLSERFWGKVAKLGPDECWLWQAHCMKNGYGSLVSGSRTNGQHRSRLAHRIAWELTNGPIPEGLNVCHRCDAKYPIGDITYRRCCNPAHLFVGTQTDNMHDASQKGRLPKMRPSVRGEHHYMRKKTNCLRGHPYNKANTLWLSDGTRQCRLCARIWAKRWKIRRQQENYVPQTAARNGSAHHNGKKKCCPKGHRYTKANTYTNNGRRFCRTCRQERKILARG